MGFTHYSLFQEGSVIADFEPLPKGGLPELLADLHKKIIPDLPTHCISICPGTLHPDGQQMSFGVGIRSQGQFFIILMTRDCVAEHAIELSSEGNHVSAAKAVAAVRDVKKMR